MMIGSTFNGLEHCFAKDQAALDSPRQPVPPSDFWCGRRNQRPDLKLDDGSVSHSDGDSVVRTNGGIVVRTNDGTVLHNLHLLITLPWLESHRKHKVLQFGKKMLSTTHMFHTATKSRHD